MLGWFQVASSGLKRSKRLRVFVLTYTAYSILYATRKPFSVVKTQVQSDLSISTRWLGIIDTCFLGSYAVGQLLLPQILSKRLDTISSLVLCFLGSGVIALLFGFASSALVFSGLWIINGLFHSSVFPLMVGNLLVPQFSGASRGSVMGAWTTSQQIGAILATTFSAALAEIYGWRSVFIVPGLLTIVFSFGFNRVLRQTAAMPDVNPATYMSAGELELRTFTDMHLQQTTTRAESAVVVSDTEASPSSHERMSNHTSPGGSPKNVVDKLGFWHTLRTVGRIPDLKPVGVSYFCIKCIRYSLLFWLPFYLSTELKYTAETAGYASILFDVGGIVGGILAGQMADKLCGGRRTLVACLFCFMTGISTLVFAHSAHWHPVIALTLMALVGWAVAGADSLIGGSLSSDLCERAGHGSAALSVAAGLVNGAGSLGAVIQGYATAKISEEYGWLYLYYMLSLGGAIGSGFLILPSVRESQALTNRTTGQVVVAAC